MKLSELRATFRTEVSDTVSPYLWSDAEIDGYANDAVMEAVRRGVTIVDSATPDICEIAYTTDPVLELDSRVIAIRSARIDGQTLNLKRCSTELLDEIQPGWQSAVGLPFAYVDDWVSGSIRLHPSPIDAGKVLLSVTREPLGLMRSDNSAPEIPGRYHRSLLHWMKYRAWSNPDSETLNLQAASIAEAAFRSEFGERVSARNERWAAEQGVSFPDTLC